MNLIQEHIPLRKLTWMKVDGPAEYYAEVRTRKELLEAFGFAEERGLPVMYLGQGSNMILAKLIRECRKQGLNGLDC